MECVGWNLKSEIVFTIVLPENRRRYCFEIRQEMRPKIVYCGIFESLNRSHLWLTGLFTPVGLTKSRQSPLTRERNHGRRKNTLV